MTNAITSKQQDILQFIRNFLRDHGFSPSIREIGTAFGKSTNGINDHLNALEAKGAITRSAHVARSIRLVEHPAAYLNALVAKLEAENADLRRQLEGKIQECGV